MFYRKPDPVGFMVGEVTLEQIYNWVLRLLGAHDDAVEWRTELQAGRLRVWFQMVSLELFIDIILPAHDGLGVDPVSKRNEFQEYFLGGRG